MQVQRLALARVRNIQEIELKGLGQINLIYGLNGSGKTSLLEAIHLLSLGRSFRTHKIRSLITKGQRDLWVSATVQDAQLSHQLGISRDLGGAKQMRINQQPTALQSDLAALLPIQLVNVEAFDLVCGGPDFRRQFIDWGLFHVEPSFLPLWRSFQRCLKQRNQLIRQHHTDPLLYQPWDAEFATLANQLTDLRQSYIERLLPFFNQSIAALSELQGILLSYYPGWDQETPLLDLLQQNLSRDLRLGYSLSGPHRGDLRIQTGLGSAADILSRGQQKLVVLALKLAQAEMLWQLKQRQAIFVIDDLPSELDVEHRGKLCRLVESMDFQCFITGTDLPSLNQHWTNSVNMQTFHVKHGKLEP